MKSVTVELPNVDVQRKLFTTRFKADKTSHLSIRDVDVCRECKDKPCLWFCPAEVYKWEDERITIAFEGCLECGTCRIGCPFDNIDWRYPRGGFGVQYKFG
ncbi:MAG: 4Fe-4S dicluster domain-containing protein [Limnochordales bacterium]|nr:4Fe-4S dicluster domain-containing protein [Limnochordales bacterium]